MSENREVRLKIKSVISSKEGKEELVSIEKGNLYEKDEKIYVLYEEQVEDGLSSKCRIKIADDLVEIKKSGAYTTLMTFMQGNTTNTLYRTPYGAMEFAINTGKLTVKKSDVIEICLEYELCLDTEVLSEHTMRISIE